MEQNFCLRWFFLCLRPVGLLVCQTIEEGLTTITKTLKLTHTYESISYSFRFPFGTVYYINCYNDAQAETMRLMLLTTTKQNNTILLKTTLTLTNETNKLTSDTILITTNAMHVFRTIFPHIYKCNATRKKNIQHNTTHQQKQTNKTAGGAVTQNNQVGHAPPQFDSSERGYAPGNENKKKHRKEKLKQSKPTVSAQPKQKTYEMNENQTRLLGSFSLRINMWSSSCHYTIFKNIIIFCYM